VDKVHGLWTVQGWPVHGGLTTGTGRRTRRSVARQRCRAQELTAGWGKRRGAPGVLTEGFGGRFDIEARPAAVKLSVGRLGARRVGNGGGDECGEEG
jgi:hypothetical protein